MAAGVEFSDLDWLTIVLAVVVNMVLGFIWYAPKFPTGKIWMREMNMPADHKPEPGKMAQGMVLMVVGAFLLMFVLQHTFIAYRDAYMLDGERVVDGLTFADGAIGALMVWLGFMVPLHFSIVAWEGKNWSLFWVNTLYYAVTLQIAGALYAWRI